MQKNVWFVLWLDVIVVQSVHNDFCAITFVLANRTFWIFNTTILGIEQMFGVISGVVAQLFPNKGPKGVKIDVSIFCM
jgi:hypothetical protein